MFKGRRVEHQLGTEIGEYLAEAPPVADVGDYRIPGKVRVPFGGFHVDGVKGVFGVVQKPDSGRREIAYLTDHLAADAAAGAGHQDALAFDQPPHGVPVQGSLRPAQQVLDGHRLDVKLVGDAALEIGQAGKPGQGHAELVGLLQQGADTGARHVVVGQHQPLRPDAGGPQLLYHAGDVVCGADDVDAVNLASDPVGAFGHDSDGAVIGVPGPPKGADEKLGPVPGADQENGDTLIVAGFIGEAETAVLDHPEKEPGSAQQRHQHEPIDDQDGTRQIQEPGPQEHHQQKQQYGQRHGAGDPP